MFKWTETAASIILLRHRRKGRTFSWPSLYHICFCPLDGLVAGGQGLWGWSGRSQVMHRTSGLLVPSVADSHLTLCLCCQVMPIHLWVWLALCIISLALGRGTKRVRKTLLWCLDGYVNNQDALPTVPRWRSQVPTYFCCVPSCTISQLSGRQERRHISSLKWLMPSLVGAGTVSSEFPYNSP